MTEHNERHERHERFERFERFERTGWARRGEGYDDGFGRLCAGAHPDLLAGARVRVGTRVLDVGCGTGRLSAAAQATGATVVATDSATGMAARTAAAVPAARVVAAALPTLPFADGTFDATLAAFVLNHVAEPPTALAELRRVLRADGRLAVSVWDDDGHNRALGVVSEALADATAHTGQNDPADFSPILAYAETKTLATLLWDIGLRDVSVRRVNWTHRIPAEKWWRDVLGGTVRTAACIERLDTEQTQRVLDAYLRTVSDYSRNGMLELPTSALVAEGAR